MTSWRRRTSRHNGSLHRFIDRRFKAQEQQLAAALKLTGEDAERAGALVVGRFEDEALDVLHADAQAGPPLNDFSYAAAPDGAKCPFRGHMRKTNSRGVSDAKNGPVGPRGERTHIMARRGITYGQRKPRPPGADFPEDDRPQRDVGLLFMAYMADITERFEFTQAAWAGNPGFVAPHAGIDPVIGQRSNQPGTAELHWRDGQPGQDERSGYEAQYDSKTRVTLKGGEYSFAPSIGFLYEARS